MAKGYNGHRSWAAWNVSLWIGNDEGLYRMALDYKRRYGSHAGARRLLAELPDKTPDGARYTQTSVREALAAL